MRIRFAFIDPSIETFVIGCAECPNWSAIALTRDAAYEVKANHDVRVHGVPPTDARRVRSRYLARHAEP